MQKLPYKSNRESILRTLFINDTLLGIQCPPLACHLPGARAAFHLRWRHDFPPAPKGLSSTTTAALIQMPIRKTNNLNSELNSTKGSRSQIHRVPFAQLTETKLETIWRCKRRISSPKKRNFEVRNGAKGQEMMKWELDGAPEGKACSSRNVNRIREISVEVLRNPTSDVDPTFVGVRHVSDVASHRPMGPGRLKPEEHVLRYLHLKFNYNLWPITF